MTESAPVMRTVLIALETVAIAKAIAALTMQRLVVRTRPSRRACVPPTHFVAINAGILSVQERSKVSNAASVGAAVMGFVKHPRPLAPVKPIVRALVVMDFVSAASLQALVPQIVTKAAAAATVSVKLVSGAAIVLRTVVCVLAIVAKPMTLLVALISA